MTAPPIDDVLACSPDCATSGRFYVAYTRPAGCSALKRGALVISEFSRTTRNAADAGSERRLMVIKQPLHKGKPSGEHFGGTIAFGPDGLLYAGIGDGKSATLTRDKTSYQGKLLRIDPRDPDGAGPKRYRVPSSNPLVRVRGALPEIWAWGLRNPWRWAFDLATGDVWAGDVGQYRYEEVDRAPADANGRNAAKGVDFGWDR